MFAAFLMVRSTVEDRLSGVLTRIGVAPVSYFRYLWETLLAYGLLLVAQNALVVGLGVARVRGSLGAPLLQFAAFACFSLASIAFSLAGCSLFGRRELAYASLPTAIILLSMLGGFYCAHRDHARRAAEGGDGHAAVLAHQRPERAPARRGSGPVCPVPGDHATVRHGVPRGGVATPDGVGVDRQGITPGTVALLWRLAGVILLAGLWLAAPGNEVGLILILVLAILGLARWRFPLPGVDDPRGPGSLRRDRRWPSGLTPPSPSHSRSSMPAWRPGPSYALPASSRSSSCARGPCPSAPSWPRPRSRGWRSTSGAASSSKPAERRTGTAGSATISRA